MRLEAWPSHIALPIKLKLTRWANMLAAHYGAPVYLCGSALCEHNHNPRDWDVRIELPDDEFERRFGGSAQQWRSEGATGQYTQLRWGWSDECVKRSKEGWGQVGVNIDFQVYPAFEAAILHHGQPKLRIDTRDGAQ